MCLVFFPYSFGSEVLLFGEEALQLSCRRHAAVMGLYILEKGTVLDIEELEEPGMVMAGVLGSDWDEWTPKSSDPMLIVCLMTVGVLVLSVLLLSRISCSYQPVL